jgi:hypothetical protein
MARPLDHMVLDAQETQKLMPPEYHDFQLLFLEEALWQLPPKHPGIDHEINLKLDFQLVFQPIYELLQVELQAQTEWLDDNLKKGFI